MLGEFSTIISSRIFSCPFFFSFSSVTPIIQMLVCLMLSQRSLKLYSVLFILFTLCAFQKLFPPFYLLANWFILLFQIICCWFLLKYLFWGGSKITADGDCSYESKRCLLLGRKIMTKLDSILKSWDITLPTKVCLVKAMVFPVVMYGCDSWTIKKAECWRIYASEL